MWQHLTTMVSNTTTFTNVSHDSSQLFAAIEVVSIFGITSNLFSLIYILRHFDIGKAVFLLLLVDAVISMLGCLAALTFCIIATSGQFPCLAMAIITCLTCSTGLFTMMEISIIRLYSVCLSKTSDWMNERRIRNWALLALLVQQLYICGTMSACILGDVPASVMVNSCGKSGKSTVKVNRAYNMAIFIPNFVVIPMVSAIWDATTVWVLKSMSNFNNYHTVPVRATVLSTSSILPFLVLATVLPMLTSKVASLIMCLFAAWFTIVLRCPVATMVSFVHKSRVEMEVRRNSRETKLKREIGWALEERKRLKRHSSSTNV